MEIGLLLSDALNKTNWLSISYKSLVHIRFIFFQTFPNSGNAMKNAKEVLWNISEGVSCWKRWTRYYGKTTDWKAVLGSKISIWINSKLKSLQLVLYQYFPNYGEDLIFIQVRFLVKKERLYYLEKDFELETAS